MPSENILFLIIVGAFVASASAYIGSIMVLKRMSLVGDALSHVALPGMAIAIMLHLSPILGAFIALMLAVIGIWYLEETSDTYPDAIVGLFFTTALAIGVLITKEPDLLEALFGSIEKVNFQEGITSILISLALLIATLFLSKKIIASIISEELAKVTGIPTKLVNLLYLIVVASVVALGIRFVGTLLTGALVIVPAVSARNISKGMKNYFLISILFGTISAIVGIGLAIYKGYLAGPVVVLVSVVIFLLTYFYKTLIVKN
jgi:ABC-type Mn2+/Zn2+ transport system permease subunit